MFGGVGMDIVTNALGLLCKKMHICVAYHCQDLFVCSQKVIIFPFPFL